MNGLYSNMSMLLGAGTRECICQVEKETRTGGGD